MKNEEKTSNILTFKKDKNKLTDGDINGLFLGLVRLIKKSAMDEVMQDVREERQSAGFMLKKSINEINVKERQIEELTRENIRLKNEVEGLKKDKLQRIKMFSANLKTHFFNQLKGCN